MPEEVNMPGERRLVCNAKFLGRPHARLGECRLDDRPFNKSLQKIVESLRICDAAKQELSAVKRRR